LSKPVKRCRNRARWDFWDDKFFPGYFSVCTTCLFALYREGISDARLSTKSWLLRGQCCFHHSADYREVVESLNDRFVDKARKGTGPQLVVGDEFGAFLSFRESVRLENGMEELDFDLQIPAGSDPDRVGLIRIRARWLAVRFCGDLKEAGYDGGLEAIRYMQASYMLTFRRDDRLQRADFPEDVVNDMADPSKPRPETKAKYRAISDLKIKNVLKAG
jgi:hypothetical protein